MKRYIFILSLITFVSISSCSLNEKFNANSRETNFNSNWKFIRADVTGVEQTHFDDSQWRLLDLPHDFSIEDLTENEGVEQIGPFSKESPGKESTAHVMGGTAWYRKHFTLQKEDKNKIVKVLFDGVYMNADFWLNGQHLGNHPYGYTAFAFDLTPFLNPHGEENILAVQIKNEGKNSRWYSGSGIYRDVKLIKTNPVHVDLWGIFITTPEVSLQKAQVQVETNVVNASEADEEVSVRTELFNTEGALVGTTINSLSVPKNSQSAATVNVEVENPALWSTANPNLYSAKIRIEKNGKTIDEKTEKFGIRSIEFSAGKGFLLNGESVLLKGGCLHHDNGILGSAAFKSAEYRRVRKMKENGFNAIRTAHNPPSEHFLNACDELGMLVMDESFDQWQLPKNPNDYNLYFNDWWERDTESMVLRDRNHPSIIIWSVGNEIKERADSSGLEIFRNLRGKVLENDPTRPVTQAICSFWETRGRPWEDSEKAFAQMDVHGYNYQWVRYETDHNQFPERIIIGTESIAKEAFENWQMVEKHPYVIGDFVWTGMDHLGESGIGHTKLDNDTTKFLPPWPWHINYSGDVSILGYKKPQMYYRDVIWRNSPLEMLVHSPIPAGRKEVVSFWGWPNEWKSWNWPGFEEHPLQVSVYTRCDEVRLELNGKEVGTKKVSENTKLTAVFDVPFQPGELVAIGFTEGKEVARQLLKTAGPPAQLKLTAESENSLDAEEDLAYFNVEVLDENGVLVPNAEIPVEFSIEGDCTLQAVGNGNPAEMKSFQQPKVNSFRGQCQLIVRLTDKSSSIAITAKSGSLPKVKSSISVQK